MSKYPRKLQEIVDFFEGLSPEEKRENLIAYADQAQNYEPSDGEVFDLEDVRKDQECADTVGIYLKVDDKGGLHFKVKMGSHVQTLTKAMGAILCQGLEGIGAQEIMELDQDFVTKIIGVELVRVRSQTVYYVLSRIKGICKVYLGDISI